MIRRLLSQHVYSSLKQKSSLLTSFKNRINSINTFYHSDSIEGNIPDEPSFDEQRLSSQEATGILRTHETSIDLEVNCPVKYYEVNYLGANNPPGILDRHISIQFYLFYFKRIDKHKHVFIHRIQICIYLEYSMDMVVHGVQMLLVNVFLNI